MAGKCKIERKDGIITSVTAPNGKPSILFDSLLVRTGDPEAAADIHAQIYSPEFKEAFGMDFETDPKAHNATTLSTDENGEPRIMDGQGEYYAINTSTGERVPIEGMKMNIEQPIRYASRGMQDEVVHILMTFLNDARNIGGEAFNSQLIDFMGDGKKKGILAEIALTQSFSWPVDMKMSERRNIAVEAERLQRTESSKAMMDYLPEGVKLERGKANLFFRVYRDWFSKVDEKGTGNTLSVGWSELVKDVFPDYGYRYSEDEGVVEDNDDDPVRIHSQSRLQENPKDKLSSTVKSFLTDIRSTTRSPRLGYPIAIPLDTVYLQIAEATHGQSSFQGMLKNLELMSKYKPELQPVIERMESLDVKQEAAFFANFANSYKRFLTFRLDREEVQGGDYVVSFKMFPSHANTIPSRAKAKWRANAIDEEGESPDALYYLDDDARVKIRKDKQETVSKLYKEVIAPLKRKTARQGDVVTEEQLNAVSRILWNSGVKMGETFLESKMNLGIFFENGDLAGSAGLPLLKKYIFHPHKSLSKLVAVVEKGDNVHTTEGGREVIDLWSKVVPYFVTDPAESFLGGGGKVYYPINLSTPLDNMVRDLKSDRFFDFAATVGLTPLFDPTSKEEDSSPLMRIFLNKKNQEPRKALLHELEDSFKGLDNSGVGQDYSEQNFKTSLLVRLNAFANNSGTSGKPSKYFKFAIPTQETRERLDFLTLPRFEDYSKLGAYNMKSVEDFIRATIIQDMAVMYKAFENVQRAKRGETSLIEGYHYKKGSDRFAMDGSVFTMPQISSLKSSFTAGNIPLFAQFDLLNNPESYTQEEIAEVNKRIDALVAKVSEQIDEYEAELQAAMARYQVTNDELDPYLRDNKAALRSFVVNDFVARIEVNKILRAGTAYSKDGADFYKRMGLINTPGTLLFIKGTGTDKSSDYGMNPTYKVAVFKSLDFQNKEDAEKTADTMFDNMAAAGTPENRARIISNSYVKVDKTDAQGFQSVHMWRRSQMGKGEWDMVLDEQAYRNELRGEGYVDNQGRPRPVGPEKPFHEEVSVHDDTAMVSMDKTHFTVLLGDLVKGYPVLQDMYDAMTKQKLFDVALENGATKGARLDPVDIYAESIAAAPVMVKDSSKLRFPQNVPTTGEKKIILSRQVRRNLMADWSITDASGRLDTSLMEEFDALIADNVEEDLSKLEKSLGLDAVMNAVNIEDRAEAKLRYLQKLRNLLRSQIRTKGLSHNYLGALDIVPNGPGDYRFAVPLSFPNYQSKFEQIFLSVYNDRVFKQKLMGKSLVQIGEIGGHEVDGELQMYDGSSPAEVRMRASDLGFPPGTSYEDVDINDKRLLVIGYRMPNQGKNSMLPMHVVDFLPDNYEKSIIVPGGITRQMGSDFDVDKLNIIQRGLGTPNEKIRADQPLGRKDRDARIWDIMWNVLTAPEHLEQVLDPLDNDALYNLADKAESAKKSVDYNDPLNEIEMEMKNKLGSRMIGIWANALSGHSMAQQSDAAGAPYLALSELYTPKFDGAIFDRIGSKTVEMTEEEIILASKGIVSHMNVAVDAGKNPIHKDINDNKFTASAKALLLTTGVPLETATMLMMQPAVRDVVEYLENNSMHPGQLNHAVKKIYEKYGGKGNLGTMTTDIDSEMLLTGQEDRGFQRQVLQNFKALNEAGRALMTAFKVITPDSLENMNEISGIRAWLDVEKSYLEGKSREIVEGAENFIAPPKDKNALYPSRIQVAYRQLMDRALTNAEAAGFINNRPAFYRFKERIKTISGSETLSADQHKFIDRALFLKLMSMKQSPWHKLMSRNNMHRMYVDKKNNIAARFSELKDSGKLKGNPMFDALEKDNVTLANGKAFFSISFRGAKEAGPNYQNRLSDGMYEMMESSDPDVRAFAVDLVAHQLVSTGYHPGPRSYMEVLPKEFFATSMVVPGMESPANYFAKIQEETLDQYFFDDFIHEFVLNYGTASPGGRPILTQVSKSRVKGLSMGIDSIHIDTQGMRANLLRPDNTWAPYFVSYLGTGPEIYAYREEKNAYFKLAKKGIPKRFTELVGDNSIFGNSGSVMTPTIVESYTQGKKKEDPLPESVSEPIRKLCRIG